MLRKERKSCQERLPKSIHFGCSGRCPNLEHSIAFE